MSNLASKLGQIGPKWENLGHFMIRFSIFWLAEPKYTETDLLKVPDLSHLGPIWPNFDPN